jgi:hypothetical protein
MLWFLFNRVVGNYFWTIFLLYNLEMAQWTNLEEDYIAFFVTSRKNVPVLLH